MSQVTPLKTLAVAVAITLPGPVSVKRLGGDNSGPEAQRLQKLFQLNCKCCVREVLEGSNNHRCDIPVNDLQAFFRSEYLLWASTQKILKNG